MRCLCCNKELVRNETNGWHKSCIKKFFGTSVLPSLDLSKDTINNIVNQNVKLGYTIPGVQKKLSLSLSHNSKDTRLTLVNYPSGYILKPQVEEYLKLPESEQLVMSLANLVGIKTVPHALIKLQDGNYAYITKRIDRIEENGLKKLVAMEDFCQLGNQMACDKYRGSYEKCARIIDRYSSQRGLDLPELFYRILFFYVTGNSDMHMKNFSLIEKNNNYILSDAYDLVPVNIILPSDSEELALTLNGKKKNLRRSDFYKYGLSIGLLDTTINKLINNLLSFELNIISLIKESYLCIDQKEVFISLVINRMNVLKK